MSGSGGLYPRLLGPAWDELDQAVQRAHAEGPLLRAVGSLRVRHRPGRWAGLLPRVARVPAAGEAVVVRLLVERRGAAERWRRWFGGAPLVSLQRAAGPGLLDERFGPLALQFRLLVEGGALVYRQVGAALRFGPLRMPLPAWSALRVSACEEGAGPDRTWLTVEVRGPGGAFLFSYAGCVAWEGDPA